MRLAARIYIRHMHILSVEVTITYYVLIDLQQLCLSRN